MKKRILALLLTALLLSSAIIPAALATGASFNFDSCPTCGQTICQCCKVCGAYPACEDGTHVKCDICGEYDCTKEHVQCEICKAYDCADEHVYCDVCAKYDCGIDHNVADDSDDVQPDDKQDTTCNICGNTPCTCEPAEGDGEDKPVCPGDDTCTIEGCPEHAVEKAFNKMTVEEQYAYILTLTTNEEIEAALATLTEEQVTALTDYAVEAEKANAEPPKTVSYTSAGPFMPPVQVIASYARRMFAAPASETGASNEGVETSKTVEKNAEGDGYTITIESYVTGETTVTTETRSIPVDIVLVLDQSRSMAFDFNGNETSTNSARRQYAMKNAVNNFIASVGEKYDAEDADHRIAIVTFGSNASTLQGWTYVNAAGVTTLQGSINRLPNSPSGATNVGAGMQTAETLMGSGYSYSGANTNRQKVVIVFTDGVPTTSSDFSTSVANTAISSAKNLKDAGATIYTIGIFTGANPDELYGSSSSSGLYRYSDGTVNSSWSAVAVLIWGDVAAADTPAGNRFLNYLSSNYAGATEIGLTRSGFNFIVAYTQYTINVNQSRTASGYYLTADNATALNNIFTTISNNIQTGTASVTLGSTTVIKDVIAEAFELPEGADASVIKVYTADYNSDGTWDEPVLSTLTPTVSGNTVTVTGFDFSQNYCDTSNGRQDGNNNAAGDFYGRKLIIEIPIVVKDGFLGGNDVLTNGAGSGIYGEDGTAVEDFEYPSVDVAIAPVTVTVADKNVYLHGNLTAEQLVDGAVIKCGDVVLDLAADNYGLADWQTAYVDIPEASGLGNIVEDQSYTVSCTVSPINEGTATAQSGSATGKINVFKPVQATADSAIYLSQTADYDNNMGGLTWKHGDTLSTSVTMIGTAPTVTYTYSPAEAAFTADTNVNITAKIGSTNIDSHITYTGAAGDDHEFTVYVYKPEITFNDSVIYLGETPDYDDNGGSVAWKATSGAPTASGTAPDVTLSYDPSAAKFEADTYVNVTVTIGGADHTGNTTFKHGSCNEPGCGFNPANGEFIVHVRNCTLTITKSGANSGDSFLFNVTGPNGFSRQVVITGNGSVTLTGLRIGEYTVTEDTSWSWRYTTENGTQTANITAENTSAKITVTNNYSNDKWLGDETSAVNKFTKNN